MKSASSSSFFETFGELLTGRIHRPRFGDPLFSLGERFRSSSLVLVMLAKDRAATLSVRFDSAGRASLGRGQQFALGQEADLARVLAQEAQNCGASWVFGVLALGWRCEIGLRSARGAGQLRDFDSVMLGVKQPELLVARVRSDWVYSAVDHPALDRSLVFSCRKKDLEMLTAACSSVGLGLAGVRVSVAAQLECWLQSGGALDKDLLVSDGMSALLVNMQAGDFVAPSLDDAGESEALPRQASTRPKDLPQDLMRFARDNEADTLVYLGPREFHAPLMQGCPGKTILPGTDSASPVHDPARAALSAESRHELNHLARPERRPLARRWRPWFCLGMGLLVLSLFGAVALQVLALRGSQDLARDSEDIRVLQTQKAEAEKNLRTHARDLEKAAALRDWLLSGYHAQSFLCGLLTDLPDDVVLERLAARLDEGSAQLSLEFSLSGGLEAQLRGLRALESRVLSLGIRVGERTQVPTGNTLGCSQRWRLILSGGKGGA